MNLIFKTLTLLIKEDIAYAHCDIPCGIYDTQQAQLAAHTVIRMTELLSEFSQINLKTQHDIARMTKIKEQHANIIEEELETLENDYFKKEHYEQYPNLQILISETIKLIAKARQNIDLENSQKVLEGVLQISEIYYKSKSVTPIRIKSIFPTEREVVTYK